MDFTQDLDTVDTALPARDDGAHTPPGPDAATVADTGADAPPDDREPDDTPPTAQSLIDRAIGRRLAAERERWERTHAQQIQWLEQTRQQLDTLRADAHDTRANTLTEQVLADEQTIRAYDESFDAHAFLQANPAVLKAVRGGVSLTRAYLAMHMDDVLQRVWRNAQLQADEAVRAGRRESPGPLPGAAAAASSPGNFSPGEVQQMEQRLARGERIRLD